MTTDSTNTPARRARTLFREAVLAIEHTGGEPGRIDALRASARSMTDAFLAAHGRRAVDDAERLALIAETPILDADADGTLRRLLNPDTDTADVRALESAYRALLPSLRGALCAQIPGYRGLRDRLSSMAACRRARLSLAVAGGVLLTLVLWYQGADPAYDLRLHGQVYWKPSADVAFSEARSRRFDVRADGASHEYIIRFHPPVTMATLRLDPVDSSDATDVRIGPVRLLDADGGSLAPAAGGGEAWVCHNCRAYDADGDTARLQPGNDDPFVILPAFKPRKVEAVEVAIRATAAKDFWEWFTRLEKTHD